MRAGCCAPAIFRTELSFSLNTRINITVTVFLTRTLMSSLAVFNNKIKQSKTIPKYSSNNYVITLNVQ